MKRRTVVLFLAVAPLYSQLASGVWPPGKIARVGYLEAGAASGTPLLEAFRAGLKSHGWVEGRNLVIEVRAAEGRYERLAALAAELVRMKVDVIFASSTPAALAARHATSTIPIVIGRVADPVASGLVATLARPGGNVTGWTHQGLEMREKYLDILMDAIPTANKIGVLWNRDNPIHGRSLKTIEAAAQALKVELVPMAVQNSRDLGRVFAELTAARVDGLVVFQDGMFLSQAQRIIDLAAKTRIATIYGATEMVRAGGLMGYGVNLPDMYRQGASFVDRILSGAAPADLPVEQPTKFELVINRKTAKALGLAMPQSLLLRADEVL